MSCSLNVPVDFELKRRGIGLLHKVLRSEGLVVRSGRVCTGDSSYCVYIYDSRAR